MRGGIACECVLIGSRRRPRALRVGAAGELARWFETAIAFAGEKWAFLVRFFGRKGVVGFSGAVSGVSSGVVGFIVAMFLRAVREICRAAGLVAGPFCWQHYPTDGQH